MKRQKKWRPGPIRPSTVALWGRWQERAAMIWVRDPALPTHEVARRIQKSSFGTIMDSPLKYTVGYIAKAILGARKKAHS